jgi:hypothetical protein
VLCSPRLDIRKIQKAGNKSAKGCNFNFVYLDPKICLEMLKQGQPDTSTTTSPIYFYGIYLYRAHKSLGIDFTGVRNA